MALKGGDCEKCQSLDPQHGHLNKVAYLAITCWFMLRRLSHARSCRLAFELATHVQRIENTGSSRLTISFLSSPYKCPTLFGIV
jgi:hypothetical protein